MFTDYQSLMDTGVDLWHGVYSGIRPLPMVGLFALWSLIPYNIGAWLFCALSIVALVALFKRRALLWLFYFPIIETLALSQTDIWFLWLASIKRPIAWALMTLKPQLFLFVLPALIADRAAWRPFVLWCAALYLPVTIVRPTWIIEWLHMMDDGRLSGHSATTLLYAPTIILLAGLAVLIVVHHMNYDVIVSAFNPFLRQYDLVMIAGKVTLWAIPISWLAYLLGHQLLLPWPVALLGLLPRKRET